MMSLFGAAGKVPIAVILMVGEMTGSYTLLVPAMFATTIAYLVSGRNTIYESQVPSKTESPAHRGEFLGQVLHRLHVRETMSSDFVAVRSDMTVEEAGIILARNKALGMPVMSEDMKMVGIVTGSDLVAVPAAERKEKRVREVMTKSVIVAYPEENLDEVFGRMSKSHARGLPVLEAEGSQVVIGIITREDVAHAYDKEVDKLIIMDEE